MKLYIGDKIRRFRLMRELTQSELGHYLRVDARTISSWEKNRTEPKPFQINMMAEVFGCEVEDLTGYSSTATMDIAAPEFNAVVELYKSLNPEQQNRALLYMIELSMGK